MFNVLGTGCIRIFMHLVKYSNHLRAHDKCKTHTNVISRPFIQHSLYYTICYMCILRMSITCKMKNSRYIYPPVQKEFAQCSIIAIQMSNNKSHVQCIFSSFHNMKGSVPACYVAAP